MAIKAEVKDMLAVKGIYSDGKVLVNRKLPVKTAEVIVVFPDVNEERADLSTKARKELFQEFSGSIDRVIDAKAEKAEALDERYEGTD